MSVYLSKLTLPVNVDGTVTNVEYTIKDAEARELIEDIGHAIYWIGVTTTELTDGSTTNPITVGDDSVTANLGGLASYDGSEFVWNGTAWQELGKNNFGALAFKSSASCDYTPAGTIAAQTITVTGDATDTVNSITDVGTLPDAYFTVSGETATFNWSAGALPTKGADQTVVSDMGTITVDQAVFTGTAATITVE